MPGIHILHIERCIRRVLDDPMVRVVMAADGVSDETMAGVMRGLARDLAGRRHELDAPDRVAAGGAPRPGFPPSAFPPVRAIPATTARCVAWRPGGAGAPRPSAAFAAPRRG